MSFMSMKAGVASISPWAFRNAGVECDQHEELMQLVEKANGGSFTNVVGALESNEAHSAAAWRVCYQGSLKKRDQTAKAYVEWFEQDTDYSVQVRRIRRAKPDLFILSSHYQANVGAMLEMARQGVKPKYMISHIGADAVEMLDLGGKAVEGVIFPSTAYFRDPGVESLYEKYKERTGEWYMPAFTYLAYEGMYIMKWAIESAGVKTLPETLAEDRRKIRDQLASMDKLGQPPGSEAHHGADRRHHPCIRLRHNQGRRLQAVVASRQGLHGHLASRDVSHRVVRRRESVSRLRSQGLASLTGRDHGIRRVLLHRSDSDRDRREHAGHRLRPHGRRIRADLGGARDTEPRARPDRRLRHVRRPDYVHEPRASHPRSPSPAPSSPALWSP